VKCVSKEELIEELCEPELLKAAAGAIEPLLAERISQEVSSSSARFFLRIPRDLKFVEGHFPDLPVVPGFVQLWWSEFFAREVKLFSGFISKISAVKFSRPLYPGAECKLNLSWQARHSTLHFSFFDQQGVYSSGRFLVSPQ